MSEKHYDEEGRVIRENRSQAKREREHIKIFARELLKLPAHQYPLLPIDETLQAALVEGKRLSGNALSRHLNYLTRLLDEQGYEEILAAHEHVNHPYLHSPGKQQRIQGEIARLLAGDADIYGELLGCLAAMPILICSICANWCARRRSCWPQRRLKLMTIPPPRRATRQTSTSAACRSICRVWRFFMRNDKSPQMRAFS